MKENFGEFLIRNFWQVKLWQIPACLLSSYISWDIVKIWMVIENFLQMSLRIGRCALLECLLHMYMAKFLGGKFSIFTIYHSVVNRHASIMLE